VRLVSGVTIDRIVCEKGSAVAVEAIDQGGERVREDGDEVIVCLGTYASPALLMRSGIGPPQELARHEIPVVLAQPAVGQAMMDHPKVSYRFWLDLDVPVWPHPWIQALVTAFADVGGEDRLFQVMPYVGTTDAGHRFSDFNVQVADARSRRGTVTLQGTDPRSQPVLRMGWLEDDGDRAVAVEAGRELMAIARTAPLLDVLHPWPNQDDADHPLRTVETFHHPVGTCRMGRDDDPGAVVDATGRVFGVAGLSVIDASIIPRVPSANTHLCVIALAERLAERFRTAARDAP
jgi:choline dehydrogenase